MGRPFVANSPADKYTLAASRIFPAARGSVPRVAFVPKRWLARRVSRERSIGWWLKLWKISYAVMLIASFKSCRLCQGYGGPRKRSRFAICNLESPRWRASLSPEHKPCRELFCAYLVTKPKGGI